MRGLYGVSVGAVGGVVCSSFGIRRELAICVVGNAGHDAGSALHAKKVMRVGGESG